MRPVSAACAVLPGTCTQPEGGSSVGRVQRQTDRPWPGFRDSRAMRSATLRNSRMRSPKVGTARRATDHGCSPVMMGFTAHSGLAMPCRAGAEEAPARSLAGLRFRADAVDGHREIDVDARNGEGGLARTTIPFRDFHFQRRSSQTRIRVRNIAVHVVPRIQFSRKECGRIGVAGNAGPGRRSRPPPCRERRGTLPVSRDRPGPARSPGRSSPPPRRSRGPLHGRISRSSSPRCDQGAAPRQAAGFPA